MDDPGADSKDNLAISGSGSLYFPVSLLSHAVAAEEEETNDEAAQERQDSDDAEEEAAADDTEAPMDLKLVVSIKGGRATIGVQRPAADPHIEFFDGQDLCGLAQEVLAVTERARAKWEDEPRHPAHQRPAPQPRRRNRREQTPAQAATDEEGSDQQQPETLRLF